MNAVLEIDLDRIAANWRLLRDRQKPALTAAVVKADGYGLGAVPVVRRLVAEGCRAFFTAQYAEAMAIRPTAPTALIAVLNGLAGEDTTAFAAAGLAPVLNSMADVDAWTGEARRLGRRLPALLHIDSGMNRLGLEPGDVARLAAAPALLDGIALLFLMTHLASPEQPDDPLNADQLRRFNAACARLPPAPRSIPASSRPGAALYGVNPTPGQVNPMAVVATLRAPVLQVREIEAGERVGYNGIWRAARRSRIATLPVGYADGFSRHLSNCAAAFFDGRAVPLVGRVSMDLTTFDVTDLPEIQPGVWLELMGPHQTPDDLAARAGTNGYEILTSTGHRYTRRYQGVMPCVG
jgi:alanine racemase